MRTMRLFVLVVVAMAGCGDDREPEIVIDVVVRPPADAGVDTVEAQPDCFPRVGTYTVRMVETSIICGGLPASDVVASFANGIPVTMGNADCIDIGTVAGDCVDDFKLLCTTPGVSMATTYLGKVEWSDQGPVGVGALKVTTPTCGGLFATAWTRIH